ncbi:uncharacterized protein L969DRAFT_100040 [Mixia osmundae IAM 14324]|uniref:Uncharacterized protein n=1 Tax=Mixia osmundae (strain CBS 9802 / IAM 14324 / JCM 22182 / KY 12970) TaxID=764103 RepID=G7E251_MIXOS|nr:uncharacterized protein L969DRAFT_100040 [Mixia osmundae IAM 14324]KEI36783.1 hypothetical protein L969DRAFT_100040 [Mixia osmundae IAM 14324]GAA96911.1 hypothetical protein E5Q_03585 [Mixia osmundae IAM 14324]
MADEPPKALSLKERIALLNKAQADASAPTPAPAAPRRPVKKWAPPAASTPASAPSAPSMASNAASVDAGEPQGDRGSLKDRIAALQGLAIPAPGDKPARRQPDVPTPADPTAEALSPDTDAPADRVQTPLTPLPPPKGEGVEQAAALPLPPSKQDTLEPSAELAVPPNADARPIPTSVVLPAMPKRAAPPRRKVPAPKPSPDPDISANDLPATTEASGVDGATLVQPEAYEAMAAEQVEPVPTQTNESAAEEESDAERRARIASRMAALGGHRIGLAPPPPSKKPMLPADPAADPTETESQGMQTDAPQPTTRSLEERMAAMGGQRMGMLPVPSRPSAAVPDSSVEPPSTSQQDDQAPTSQSVAEDATAVPHADIARGDIGEHADSSLQEAPVEEAQPLLDASTQHIDEAGKQEDIEDLDGEIAHAAHAPPRELPAPPADHVSSVADPDETVELADDETALTDVRDEAAIDQLPEIIDEEEPLDLEAPVQPSALSTAEVPPHAPRHLPPPPPANEDEHTEGSSSAVEGSVAPVTAMSEEDVTAEPEAAQEESVSLDAPLAEPTAAINHPMRALPSLPAEPQDISAHESSLNLSEEPDELHQDSEPALSAEEEELKRRQAIAARMAALGGVKMGVMPMRANSKRQASQDEPVSPVRSVRGDAVLQQVMSSPPPARAPPPPVSGADDDDHDDITMHEAQ